MVPEISYACAKISVPWALGMARQNSWRPKSLNVVTSFSKKSPFYLSVQILSFYTEPDGKHSKGILLENRVYVLMLSVCVHLTLIFRFISLFPTSVLVLCRHGFKNCPVVCLCLSNSCLSGNKVTSILQFHSALPWRILLSGSLLGKNLIVFVAPIDRKLRNLITNISHNKCTHSYPP